METYSKNNIDDEWANFISSNNDDISSDEEENESEYKSSEYLSTNITKEFGLSEEAPTPSNIYISTKTKIAYLNSEIDLKLLFWSIPIIPYYKPCNGVVKKQMKFNSLSLEELDVIQDKLKDIEYFDEYVISSINNPSGRIKFKDIRKISIGVSKKDLLSYRCKKKSAFYNCFVLILRLKVDELFKEFHVKVFNTGKLEIPGIQNENTFLMILDLVMEILQVHVSTKLEFKENTTETVLINSNFNCGYFIDREVLNHILKNKYNIQCIYDPCSYPGIQCKFYYDDDNLTNDNPIISQHNKTKSKNIKEVSFMIFRTGSVLIVGRCDENILLIIYEFLKNMFVKEYRAICQHNILSNEVDSNKTKQKKIRKKNIIVTISSQNT